MLNDKRTNGDAIMRPDLQAQRAFLLRAYFGVSGDTLDRFISRGYRDMNRTLRRIGQREDAAEVLQEAKKRVRGLLHDLMGKPVPQDAPALEAEFDSWHASSCDQLIRYYADLPGGFALTYGQAQKWINMTVKYCWFFGEQDLSQLEPWYAVAHMPVDRFILRAAVEQATVPAGCRTWSSWDDRAAYGTFQNAIRKHAMERQTTTLALESVWWLEYGTL
jgi:hypothetical protein